MRGGPLKIQRNLSFIAPFDRKELY